MSSYGAQLDVDINVYAKEKGAIIIDLRSDTFTKPSLAMRDAMYKAKVGDDVYGEDPTVNELQAKAAAMVGKESALFVTSGTMGNLIALMVHCNDRGCEAYCGEDSHMVLHEQGGAAQLAGVTICPLPNNADGSFDLRLLQSKFRKDRLHEPISRLIAVENPMNGRIVSQSWIEELKTIAKTRNIKMHLDGARLWNAAVAKEIPAKNLVEPFDSVTFCLSKGLGAPVGSMLCGTHDFIERARRIRKVLGGGMRQVGVLAAAGIVALDETVPLLKFDHERTRRIMKAINKVESEHIDAISSECVETNMIFINFKTDSKWDAMSFVKRLSVVMDNSDEPRVIVKALALTDRLVRFVVYRDITDDMVDEAINKILHVLKE